MPEVMVTFAEDGEAPASFLIPDWAVEALQLFVDEHPHLYSSKADLFAKWATRDLFRPLCARYGKYPAGVQMKIEDAEDMKAEADEAIEQAMSEVIQPMEPA